MGPALREVPAPAQQERLEQRPRLEPRLPFEVVADLAHTAPNGDMLANVFRVAATVHEAPVFRARRLMAPLALPMPIAIPACTALEQSAARMVAPGWTGSATAT